MCGRATVLRHAGNPPKGRTHGCDDSACRGGDRDVGRLFDVGERPTHRIADKCAGDPSGNRLEVSVHRRPRYPTVAVNRLRKKRRKARTWLQLELLRGTGGRWPISVNLFNGGLTSIPTGADSTLVAEQVEQLLDEIRQRTPDAEGLKIVNGPAGCFPGGIPFRRHTAGRHPQDPGPGLLDARGDRLSQPLLVHFTGVEWHEGGPGGSRGLPERPGRRDDTLTTSSLP